MTDDGMETQEIVLPDDFGVKKEPLESPRYQEPDLGPSGNGGGLPLGFWIGVAAAVVVALVGIWLVISSRSSEQSDQAHLIQRIERLESRVEILAATLEETSNKMRNAGDIKPLAERLDRFQSEIGVKVELLASSVGTLQKQVRKSASQRSTGKVGTPSSKQAKPPKQTRRTTTTTRHTVKKGETLYSIGRAYNVPVALLRKWNSLPNNAIRVGQKLIVKQP